MAWAREALMLLTVVTSCQSTDPPEDQLKGNVAIQREVAQNIINLENYNCNGIMSEKEVEDLLREAKWRYMFSFLGHKYTCERYSPINLEVDNLIPEKYVVKCPGDVTQFKERPAWVMTLLTNEHLLGRGVYFRIGDKIVVPGEGTRHVSPDWENGTRRQLDQRREIGNNICKWFNSRSFRMMYFCFGKSSECNCMGRLATLYYIHIYSPSGILSKECLEGKIDLHVDKPCKVPCPEVSVRDNYVDFPFTNANMYNVPSSCISTQTWFDKKTAINY